MSAPESEPADEAGQTASPLELSAACARWRPHGALRRRHYRVRCDGERVLAPAPNLAGRGRRPARARATRTSRTRSSRRPAAEHRGPRARIRQRVVRGVPRGRRPRSPAAPRRSRSARCSSARACRGPAPHGGPPPVPGFGGQLQLRAIPGFTPEVQAAISYVETQGTFTDGTPFQLRVPTYTLTGLSTRRSRPASCVSPRVAPAVFGLGLLEAVPDGRRCSRWPTRETATTTASPGGSTTSGTRRAGAPASAASAGRRTRPNLFQQTAGRLQRRHGRHLPLFPAESCEGQVPGCERARARGGRRRPSATSRFYTQTLGVPARRNLDDPRRPRASSCSTPPGAPAATSPTLRTGTLRRRARGLATRSSIRTPICCCTTWGRAWRTTGPTSRPRAASGARRRSGASAGADGERPHQLPARRPGPVAARGGDVARRRGRSARAIACRAFPRTSGRRWWRFSHRSERGGDGRRPSGRLPPSGRCRSAIPSSSHRSPPCGAARSNSTRRPSGDQTG